MLLNNHSFYSLRYGTFSPEELVAFSKKAGYKRLLLSDINNSTAMVDFVRICKKASVVPVAAMEFRRGNKFCFIAIARNNSGFSRINSVLSRCNIERLPLPCRPPQMNDVFIIYDSSYLSHIDSLKENEFVGIRAAERFKLMNAGDKIRKKTVALAPVTFKDKEDYELHRHLRAIDNNILLSKLKPGHLAAADEYLKTPDELFKDFSGFEFLLKNAGKLLEKCEVDFDFSGVKNKACYSASKADDIALLRKLAYEGMKYRYGEGNERVRKRLEKELEIIDKMGFASYFLITYDIIQYSLSRAYYHVGRGSGANSVVAYCLKITDVDPIELDLYFERFINPRRTSPPDFDIDYSWKDRNDVQDYIFKRYGKGHVALLGAISTFKGKSIYRELGKVYGLPKGEIDELIRHPAAERNRNDITLKIHRIAARMTGFPNLRSIHAGGVLVSEKPLSNFTALDLPPKGFPVTQWDMYVAEDLGYEKLDILSQRGIGHIKDAVDYIRRNKGVEIDFHRVDEFKRDDKVKELLRKGETVGCFYIESPAMRGLIKKLRCDNYLTLVAASSIIRPGVARSGMMREYIRRYNNPQSFRYLHPVMKELLSETYGIMVYQEDVLKVCHHYAGLDLGDADVLRRAMSGKTRSRDEFERIVKKFFENSRRLGRPEEVTKEVWRQIESFAGYSFSKAHSASYAVESYQSLYLKAHFPYEFITAVINNFGGFYSSWVYFNEAKRLGAKVMLPDINCSEYLTSIRGERIYIGFIHIRQLDAKLARAIVKERDKNGEYEDLDDFTARISIGIEHLLTLIRAGAFSFTGKPKAELMWRAHLLLNPKRKKTVVSPELFRLDAKEFVMPPMEQSAVNDAYDEIELLGFPVSLSYFDLLKTRFRGEILAVQMLDNVGKKPRMLGRLVTIKYVKTVKKEHMIFGTFIDVKGDFFDTVHFPQSLKNYPFRGDGIYLLKGKIVEEFGYASMEVEKMAKMEIRGR